MNKNIKIKDKDFEPYILSEEIDMAIDRVVEQLKVCYQGVTEPVVMVVTLSGAMLFAAELSKRLSDIELEWAFVKCSSYGSGTVSCGEIDFQLSPTVELKGRDVLVVEDIVDSGNTWEFLSGYINAMGVESLRIATLAIKREVYNKPIAVDFVALEIENYFVVGFGLDYDGLGRNINGIYKVTSG